MSKRNPLARAVEAGLRGYLTPVLAQDASLDLKAAVGNPTVTTWKADKTAIRGRVATALKGKLAQDQDENQVLQVLDAVLDVLDDSRNEIAAEVAADPEPAEDDDADAASRVREVCEAHDVAPEVIEAILAALKPEVDANPAQDRQRPVVKPTDTVSKPAMDAAIAAATRGATNAAVAQMRAARAAERAVQPYVGDLAVACDSADDVYREAFRLMGVDVTGVHASAYGAILAAQPKPGSQPAVVAAPAMDAAARDRRSERFPNANRLTAR